MERECPIKWKKIVPKFVLILFCIISVFGLSAILFMISNLDDRVSAIEEESFDTASRQDFIESKLANCYPND